MLQIHAIYSTVPGPDGDVNRLVEIFDTKDDAEKVLKTLESVNTNFNLYKIKDLSSGKDCKQKPCTRLSCKLLKGYKCGDFVYVAGVSAHYSDGRYAVGLGYITYIKKSHITILEIACCKTKLKDYKLNKAIKVRGNLCFRDIVEIHKVKEASRPFNNDGTCCWHLPEIIHKRRRVV